MTEQQDIDMTFLRCQIQKGRYVIRFEINKFAGVGLCHVSKNLYDALPQDFAKQMKQEVMRLLDEAISKAVTSAILNIIRNNKND